MRIRPFAAVLAGALLAGTIASAPPARADDYYPDSSFEIVTAKVSPSVISVKEMSTVPVTVTMTTRPAEGQQDQSGTVMALTEAMQYLSPADLSVTLELVGQEGSTKHWRGVANVGGPTRTVQFNGAYNCELGCNPYPTPVFSGPQIRVQASDSPVITFAKMAPVDLASRAYTVSGQVLKTSKRSFGRRLTVVVGHSRDCGAGNAAGTAVRTTPDGHFKAVLTNPITLPGGGAAMRYGQCAKILSDARDIRNRRTYVAFAATTVPWTMTLPVRAPKTVKRGTTAVVDSAAGPLGSGAVIVLERLHGRSAWRPVFESYVRPSGRVSTYIKADDLGRHVYRLRSDDSKVMSKTFPIVTVR